LLLGIIFNGGNHKTFKVFLKKGVHKKDATAIANADFRYILTFLLSCSYFALAIEWRV
jgi:hypothetical protein